MRFMADARLDPAMVLGYPIGADRRLPRWQVIGDYFERLAAANDRVRLDTLGTSTDGLPLLVATIAAPATLDRLDHFQEIQRRLADPRRCSSADAAALVAEGKTVVLLTCGI